MRGTVAGTLLRAKWQRRKDAEEERTYTGGSLLLVMSCVLTIEATTTSAQHTAA